MECVIQVVRGSDLTKNTSCSFCGKPSVGVFGLVGKKKFDGHILKGFGVCQEHLDRITALMSGEFDIDEIFLEKYRKDVPTRINLRMCPAVNISTIISRTSKICKFCGNEFYGTAVQKFCKDPRCKELREILRKKYRNNKKDKTADNITINNELKNKLKVKKGKIIVLRCRAKDSNGKRCKNRFTITYDPRIKTYPKFCEEHRSFYRRERFAKI